MAADSPPSTPPVRIAVAKLTPEQWTGKAPLVSMREPVVEWVNGWAGISVVPDELPALQWPDQDQPDERLESVRAACSAARDLSVDAVVFGTGHYADWEEMKCARTSWSKGGSGCTRVSDEVEAAGVRNSLTLVTVHAADCGYSVTSLRGVGDSTSLQVASQASWDDLREQARHEIPRVLRASPQHTVDGIAIGTR